MQDKPGTLYMKTGILILSFVASLLLCTGSFAQDTVHWRPGYTLKWEDFQGTADTASDYKALSNLDLGFNLSYCESFFSYRVVCSFDKKRSWFHVKDSTLLMHEQGHFDIAEIFARKLRRLFTNYEFNFATVQNDFNEMYNRVMDERREMDELYDKETDFSRNKKLQLSWNEKIKTELKELSPYQINKPGYWIKVDDDQ